MFTSSSQVELKYEASDDKEAPIGYTGRYHILFTRTRVILLK
jgi:hypothetical protein